GMTLRAHRVDDLRIAALLGERPARRAARREVDRRARGMRAAAEVAALAADPGGDLVGDRERRAARAVLRDELLEAMADPERAGAGDALRERVRRVTPRTARGPRLGDRRVRVEARLVEPRIVRGLREPTA